MIEENIIEGEEDITDYYPRLMRYIHDKRVIVFFESKECGYQVSGPQPSTVTRFGNDYQLQNFEDFTGTLELRNV